MMEARRHHGVVAGARDQRAARAHGPQGVVTGAAQTPAKAAPTTSRGLGERLRVPTKNVAGGKEGWAVPWWLLHGSPRNPAVSALPLRAHARSRARARRHRGESLPPALVAARRDRPAPTPTHRSATLGHRAARDAVRSVRLGRTRCCHTDLEERAPDYPTRDASSLAPRRLQGSLAVAVSNTPRVAPGSRDGRGDPVHAVGEQTLGRRADPRRTAQARRQSQQTHDPEVNSGGATPRAARAALVNVSTKPRSRDLGV